MPAFHVIKKRRAADTDQILLDVVCVWEGGGEFARFGADAALENEEHLVVGLHGKPIGRGVYFGGIFLVVESENGGDLLRSEPFGVVFVFFGLDAVLGRNRLGCVG